MNLSKLDFRALGLGSVIDAALVESVVGVSRASRDFPLAALGLKEKIEGHFRAERRREVVIVSRDDALHILEDGPASQECYKAGKRALRAGRRALRKMEDVDTSSFSPEERERHEKRLHVMVRRDEAQRRVRRDWRELSPAGISA